MENNFNQKEEEVLKFWKTSKTFEKSMDRPKAKNFVFYEGPPTANARPGIHHMETRVFKDMICRYKTMRGFRVSRRAGWDTHGLPVELQIEKQLGLHNKKDIEAYGIKEFNAKCKQSVWEYTKEWEQLTERIGFWLDMEHSYITYDRHYMEAVWFILKTAWDKKLLFQDYKVVPYCPRCGTTLSSHEVAQGYKKVKDPSIFVKFRIINPEIKNTSLLVWTTTPWTLPANVAVAANPALDYIKVKAKEGLPAEALAKEGNGEFLILAKTRLGVLGQDYEIVDEMKGQELVGLRYQAIFPVADESQNTVYKIIPADFVSLEDGSGLVHIAPAFGAEDMEAIKAQNKELRSKNLPEFPVILNVGEDGAFDFNVAKWSGMFVKKADPLIIEDLKERGLLLKVEPHEHDYPFCWRCKTPLLYYAKKSWFIQMTALRDDLIANNEKINWVPAYLKEGRFGEWLREVKDWAISRERYWGTPLPVFKCPDCNHSQIMGSLADLLAQKYTANNYFIFRHGHSDRQVKKISSCWPEIEPLPLTPEGIRQVTDNAQKLSESQKIDLIVSSDMLRAKETAKIISQITGTKVVYDKRLRDWNVGEFNGHDPKDNWDYLNAQENIYTSKPKKGESLIEVQKRMYECLADITNKYEGKNIVIVSHELPLTVLEWTLRGLDLPVIISDRFSGKIKRIETGAYRALDFKILPINDAMEIDLHRPFIDVVTPLCPKCSRKMKRTPEVLDCWLDSGSMPFAQANWPHAGKEGAFDSKNPPQLFPADFISEAIDQTRGWFYTLLSVSTVLGFGAPYKNVVSLGHVLDEKGEKMSKSKGNTVNTWDLLAKYDADAIRWYFYTVNNPGDPKLFAEKDIENALKKFLMTFWNCYVFLQTYAPDIKAPKTIAPKNVLDRWIVSRLHQLTGQTAALLDEYDIVAAARAIESFTINDLSLWYVRRSRRRLQQSQNATELKQAAQVFAYVLLNLSKIAAPFVPFLAEEIYQGLTSNKFAAPDKSVHLEAWPKTSPKLIDQNLNTQMDKVRELVTAALAQRAQHSVKVRQPLAKLTISGKTAFDPELTGLLAGEVNVKSIEFKPDLAVPLEIDWTITPELKEEGTVREIMRQIQELRKTAGFTPSDKIAIFAVAQNGLKDIIAKNQAQLIKETKARSLEFAKPERPAAAIDASVDKQPLYLAIEKC